MKKENFSEALGGIDLKYVDEAEAYRRPRARKRHYLSKALAAAACLALAVYAVARFAAENSPAAPTVDPNLPVLDILSDNYGSLGVVAMYADDFSEYLCGNPWSEDMGLTTLPVYANAVHHASYEQNRVPLNADSEAMYALLDEVISALGHDADGFEVTESYENTMPWTDGGEDYLSSITAESDEAYISVDASLAAYISFKTPVELPVDFDSASPEQCAAAGESVSELFAGLLGFDNPQVSVSGGSVNYNGERGYSVCVYDAGADGAETVVNYNLRSAELSPSEDGGLGGIRLYRRDLSQKVGDYPLISVDEARELLLNGGELPDTLETLSGDDIVGVELIYKANEYDEYFVPYYRFWLREENESVIEALDGLAAFTWYCVPAIDPQYIEGYTPSVTIN